VVDFSDATTSYGEGATATITVGGAAGESVTLGFGGASATLPLDGGGKATFTLPATLAPGSYPLTVAYAGSDTLAASDTTATYVVAKAVSTTDFAKFEILKVGKKARLKMVVKVTGLPGFAAPAGTVLVKWGSKTKQVALPASGLVKVKLAKKGKVSPVTVTYSGDGNYSGSTVTE